MKTNRLNRTVLLPALAALLGAGGAFATHAKRPSSQAVQTRYEQYTSGIQCRSRQCSDDPSSEAFCSVDNVNNLRTNASCNVQETEFIWLPVN